MYHNYNSALKKNANWHVGSNEMLLQLSWFYRFSGFTGVLLEGWSHGAVHRLHHLNFIRVLCYPTTKKTSKYTIKINYQTNPNPKNTRNLINFFLDLVEPWPHHPFELQETSYKKIPGQDVGPFFRYKAWTLGNSKKRAARGPVTLPETNSF